ncbi:DUF5069 domain-containing protein [Puniceicoccales bacterium CK1056]|uniref:DUF5069 domain-containing protein n=1 Tax=Oceanipulchritudo coccoides TaxID=2706888 RepID=A0A6B2M0F7_9BACT|nr:DUF5069 domain-containing protein [Oceanipulchritudo coccoides]NDV61507.1 DUF5069 domain-containing protein [Oceanipulchritudo coccoides]
MTESYTFHVPLKEIWVKAVKLYQDGNRDSSTYFNTGETAFLESIGHTAQEVFDFAEDFVNGGEPDFETFLLVASLRRFYFLHVMKGDKSDVVVDTGDLPAKDLSVAGIDWLPRIMPKARAKLRGEMSDDLMYGCGGDRKFFKANNLHPAEFLAFVMQNFDNDEAIIDFVASGSKTAAHS